MFFVAAKMPKDFEAILCGVRELSKRHKQHAVKQWQRESEKGTVRERGSGRGGGMLQLVPGCRQLAKWHSTKTSERNNLA